MPFSPRRRLRPLLRLLRAMLPSTAAPEAEAAAAEDLRPWEPPFDASAPAPPISYPITDLAALASRSYLSTATNFHLPFNRASVPGTGEPLPPRRRVLVCHDMQGGYRDDARPQGGGNPDAYALWHWHLIDVFVYFSHYLVTLPPPCWINAAHLHGVKVLGTFITEWDQGAEICKEMLATKTTAQMYAERLSELAAELGFDGWLINIEVKLDVQYIENLKEFVNHLTKKIHADVPGSLVIWYDAITVNGELDWQNKLNKYNKPFFDLCDGLFANYTWKKNDPQDSAQVAGNRKSDVYMGIDVFGRNTFGGGQWNTNVALDLIKKVDISTAIFAPGWVYETKQPPDFENAQNRVMVIRYLLKGCESPMIHGTIFHAKVFSFKSGPYNGANCLTVKGSLRQNIIFSQQLFDGALSMEVGTIDIIFSVRVDGNSAVGVSLDLSSRNKESTSILLAEDIATFTRKKLNHKYGSYVKADKVEPHASDNQDWVLHRATIQSSLNYILTGINIVCTLKIAGEIGPESEVGIPEANVDGSSPYHASLGSISIQKTGEDTQFPPAELWKYNIYVEMLRGDSSAKPSRSYLGVASVETFYVSNLEVPSEVTGLKFIIQASGPDGSCQELEDCPRLFLVPVDSEV
ncbi:hypothetical protein PR202_gb00891 [Eleusine coracana subsp. coracana]|uniref:mannosyl-glycoprotein endo-beta-N-acetylglucosaminidase n=1 Tax=Eleusine coracana subsp. coracana TaxID=191504 RepID=A0AAV5DTQ3_ELECO|nr:hypothetical protein PR202_gb00891 [Eleusine coracana subsp. coracana]